jgi:selenide, water dikinase
MKKIIFVGGGHSHAIALKEWGKFPLKNTEIILLSNVEKTPYSGMLPGHVAGLYSYDEIHIDLVKLAQFAGVKFSLDQCIGIDLKQKKVICENNPPLDFDYVSLDIGSTPDLTSILGGEKYSIGAKPVAQFLEKWNEILRKIQDNSLCISAKNPLSLGIVGGGAGGVELAFNMNYHLGRLLPKNQFKIHLVQRGQNLLPNHNKWVSKRVYQLLLDQGIIIHLGETVKEIAPNTIICENNLRVNCDFIFLVTRASSPLWVKNSELTTDQGGFILINSYLQSISHSFVFATGDIATMENNPRPKAGVFAVRQGKPLFRNLQLMINEKSLKPYIPQEKYLSLIGTGNKEAIASWDKFGYQSPLLWRIKDYIDSQFMRQFHKFT